MKNSSILIDSFSYRWKKKNGVYYFGNEWNKSFTPFNSTERNQFLKPFISSLLLFDVIYITIQHLEEFIGLFGIKDAHFLFTNNCIKVIDDGGSFVGFMHNQGKNCLMNFNESSFLKLDSIEERLLNQYRGYSERHLIKPLIFKTDAIKTVIDGTSLGHLAEQEIYSDFDNKNITDFLRFQNNYENLIVKEEDIVPLMRLNYANKSLIYQNELKIKNLSTEPSIQKLVNIKIKPLFSINQSEPIELFSRIIKDKNIPDLTNLYTENLISIEEIISIKNNFSGKKFRNWFNSSDYNQPEIYRQLLKGPKKTTNAMLTRFIRWSFTNLIGIIDPISGIAASTVDSFVVNKILNGWHPNFFLDDVLDDKIQSILKEQEKINRRKKIELKFGNKIRRNDECPCKSGLKYKKCCMKQ